MVTGSGQVLNVLAVARIHLTSSLSLSCVYFSHVLSPSGYTLISHGVWREKGSGGDYTDCYSCVRCLFVCVCTCQMHVSWFMHTFPQPVSVPCSLLTSRQSSDKPAGIRRTACVCICVRVCMWGKVESRVFLSYWLSLSLSSSNNNFTSRFKIVYSKV